MLYFSYPGLPPSLQYLSAPRGHHEGHCVWTPFWLTKIQPPPLMFLYWLEPLHVFFFFFWYFGLPYSHSKASHLHAIWLPAAIGKLPWWSLKQYDFSSFSPPFSFAGKFLRTTISYPRVFLLNSNKCPQMSPSLFMLFYEWDEELQEGTLISLYHLTTSKRSPKFQ